MLEFLASFIINFIAASGYFGIFLLMLIESALIPMPSEVTMPFSGYLTTTKVFNFWFVVIAGTLGNLIGSLAAYTLGYWGEDHIVRQFIRKYGKYLLISEHEYERSERWFRKFGEFIVFISRLLPVVRTYISLPAGIAKMNLHKFIFYTTVGSFIWSLFLAYIGMVLGQNWQSLGGFFHAFDAVIVFCGVIFLAWYIKRKFKKRHHT